MNCSTCRFFAADLRSEDAYLVQDEHVASAGECRFNAPVVVANDERVCLWPIVFASEWCGRYAEPSK